MSTPLWPPVIPKPTAISKQPVFRRLDPAAPEVQASWKRQTENRVSTATVMLSLKPPSPPSKETVVKYVQGPVSTAAAVFVSQPFRAAADLQRSKKYSGKTMFEVASAVGKKGLFKGLTGNTLSAVGGMGMVPFWRQVYGSLEVSPVLAWALGSVTAIGTMHPFRYAITRRSIEQSELATIPMMKKIASEKGVRNLMGCGFIPSVIGRGLFVSGLHNGSEYILGVFQSWGLSPENKAVQASAGTSAGVITAGFTNVFELIRIRMQTAPTPVTLMSTIQSLSLKELASGILTSKLGTAVFSITYVLAKEAMTPSTN